MIELGVAVDSKSGGWYIEEMASHSWFLMQSLYAEDEKSSWRLVIFYSITEECWCPERERGDVRGKGN